jgi:ubiquinone/menaquinone biosynthesis C-methylase UbiE
MVSGFQLARAQAEAYEAHSGVFMGPSAELMVDHASPGAGDVVLDLACGTGLIARAARSLVRPSGRVVAVDVNPAMLTAARALAGPGIEWFEAPAEAMPFEDAAFTHVLCQQGFQFFADPPASAREAHRVLRPDGTLLATVWATPGLNPYIETQLELLAELDPAAAPSARAATPPHADEMLASMASDAGFDEVTVSPLEHRVLLPDLRTFFFAQTSTTPWASAVSALPAAEQQHLATEFAQRLAPCANPDGSHLVPFRSHLLVARRADDAGHIAAGAPQQVPDTRP